MDIVRQAKDVVTVAHRQFGALCADVNCDSTFLEIFSIGRSLEDLSHSLYRLSSSDSAVENDSIRNVLISPLANAKDGQQRDYAFWSVLLDDMATITQWLRDVKLQSTEAESALQLIETRSKTLSILTMIRGYNKVIVTLIDTYAL
jgi:Mg2+ and Co2+ transporter CorA